MSILNVWFTDKSVYKTMGNTELYAVGVVYGITVLWYIPLVAESVLFGSFLVTVVQGGDSTRYYVTSQAMRLRAASVVCLYVIVHNCIYILHNIITIITACYGVYAQNGLFIFSTMILYMLNLSVNYNLKVSLRRNIFNCSFTRNSSYTMCWYSHSRSLYQISHSQTR